MRIWSCLDLNNLIFEADSEYELENIDFQNFWKFHFSPQFTPYICMQWRHQKFFCGGHRGGKMRFWGGKNPKICRKWLMLAIFFFWRGASGGGAEPPTGGAFPPPPVPPPPLDAAVFACMRWRGSRGDDHVSSFLAWKSYQNINFDQIKNRDINLMIIYLIFYPNFNLVDLRNLYLNMVVFGLELLIFWSWFRI